MKWLRNLGWPLSLLYGWVVFLRNKFYDWGWFSSREYEVPVLCIGNLSTGGSGKTPMVEWLLTHLPPQKRVAVLSRGYKRQSRGFQRASKESNVADIGDEPLQIARKFPDAIVAVDANRRRGIETLIAQSDPGLILLDDGFQHRKVRPYRSMLLTAYDELYPKEAYLPTGNLRDHRSQARRADLVVVTKCPENLSAKERDRVRNLLKLHQDQQLAFSSLCYKKPVNLKGEPVSAEALGNQPLTLVTGIARTDSIRAYLNSLGIVFEHLKYGDHHTFTEREIRQLSQRYPILTTEKDAVRMEGSLPDIWVLPVAHCFEREDQAVVMAFLKQF